MSSISFNVGMFGSGGVGKTAITFRYILGIFTENYELIIEDVYTKKVNIDGKTINIEILDTAGQDDFAQIRYRYMQNADGFVFVYSILDAASLPALEDLHKDVCQANDKTTVPCVMAANKCDMKDDKSVPFNKGQELAQKLGCDVLETSAKTAQNINELFENVLRVLMRENDKSKSTGGGCCEMF